MAALRVGMSTTKGWGERSERGRGGGGERKIEERKQ